MNTQSFLKVFQISTSEQAPVVSEQQENEKQQMSSGIHTFQTVDWKIFTAIPEILGRSKLS